MSEKERILMIECYALLGVATFKTEFLDHKRHEAREKLNETLDLIGTTTSSSS